MLQTHLALIACLLTGFSPKAALGPGLEGTNQSIEDEPVEVNIEDLTGVDYKRGRKLPKNIRDLDGKRIKITGYMAIGTLEGTSTFELVPESCECGRSKVQHFIEVEVENGGVTYQPGRVDLEGVLSVGEVEEDGFVVSLYRLKIENAP